MEWSEVRCSRGERKERSKVLQGLVFGGAGKRTGAAMWMNCWHE